MSLLTVLAPPAAPTPPATSILARRALGLLDHLSIDDESDYLLAQLVLALLDPALSLSLAAHGDDDSPGAWQHLTDPAIANLSELPHAAQWTGGVLPAVLPNEGPDDYLERARAEVVQPRGMRRGSGPSLRVIAESRQTGTRAVRIAEHPDDDRFRVAVLVRESETTDVAALEAAVNDPTVIAAGVKADVEYFTTGTWTLAELEDIYTGRTLADLEGDFATLSDLETNGLA